MKYILIAILTFFLSSWKEDVKQLPDPYKQVDQVLWIVTDLTITIGHWQQLGFNQILDLDTVTAVFKSTGKPVRLKIARANLGGANITWIQPLGEVPLFSAFLRSYGQGAMSLVHRMKDREAVMAEIKRLSGKGVSIHEEISILTSGGES